jgi:hypothetical protein
MKNGIGHFEFESGANFKLKLGGAKGKEITNKDIKSLGLYDNELKVKSKGLYRFISKKNLLCTGNYIKDCVLFTKQNAPMTYDSNHLSFEFAKIISDSLIAKKINVFK